MLLTPGASFDMHNAFHVQAELASLNEWQLLIGPAKR
jgi:hypothetical protein